MEQENLPQHIAIIMDGNRRWAKEKGIATKEGHKAGADNLENIAKFCNKIGVKYLTVYAFSTENWKRSKDEVSALMLLLKNYLKKFSKDANKDNIKINILGDIDNLEDGLKKDINAAIERTKNCTGLTLNIAFNYGGRAEITNAVKKIAQMVANKEIDINDINEKIVGQNLYTETQPDPDKYWPDFNNEDLLEAIKTFNKRNRKFGGK